MKKSYLIISCILLLFIVFSVLRFKSLNVHNEVYAVQIDHLSLSRNFGNIQGIKFHALHPLKPIKYYDPYNNRESMMYILPLDITNMTTHEINLLSNNAISNELFYSKVGYFYNLIPYSMELPEKYKFNPVIPAGKTVRGYIGSKYFLGDDPNRNYKEFSNDSSKVTFVYFSKDVNGKYHELEIPIN